MHMTHHDGGYSLFRADLTSCVMEHMTLLVAVDNAANDTVYPQFADFTFYGGIYRNVSLIGVPKAHFAMAPFGTPGLRVTPTIQGSSATVQIDAELSGLSGDELLRLAILDGADVAVQATVPASACGAALTIPKVHRWHGRRDPFLYTCRAQLCRGERLLDERVLRFGCRTCRIDPERGFILNDEPYPLRGVCRHQDRPTIGNALLPEHHREDIDLICEVGANTIRLAHYQHDQYFYDLCDERGLVVWAEIPFISKYMPGGRDNTVSQMTELITQCRHHACIAVWGLSNEITMRMEDPNDPDMVSDHRMLHELAHRLDPTRLTTLAAISNCPTDALYIHIPDVVSYNLYFGWYGGSPAMTGEWLDRFHAQYPDRPIGIAEYGCEALNWHSANPVCGDYS